MTVDLPDTLRAAIDVELARQPAGALTAAVAALTEAYAHGRPSPIADQAWQAAYLAVRLPATYASVAAVLAQVSGEILGGVRSLLDLGAGPGTATWAALDRCTALTTATQVDRSQSLLGAGARLGAAVLAGRALTLSQHTADLSDTSDWQAADLVIAAYALSELAPAARASAVRAAWRAATQLLVIVEPGTVPGFERIHDARAALIAAGAAILAPCPHEGTCPMRNGERIDDWCHFAVRLPRTRQHRQLKGGTLGYEDEKFAYVVATRGTAADRPLARVLRHPRIEKGRILLSLCTPDGAVRRVVKRRDPSWHAARKTAWGDGWRPAPDDQSD